MTHIESYRDRLVWQKSMDLAVRCYRAAQALPKSEQQVLGYQLRKSSVSMPSNVAEGHSRHSTPHISSTCGPLTHPARNSKHRWKSEEELNCSTTQQAETLIRDAQEVGRMINGLVRSLERSDHSRSR